LLLAALSGGIVYLYKTMERQRKLEVERLRDIDQRLSEAAESIATDQLEGARSKLHQFAGQELTESQRLRLAELEQAHRQRVQELEAEAFARAAGLAFDALLAAESELPDASITPWPRRRAELQKWLAESELFLERYRGSAQEAQVNATAQVLRNELSATDRLEEAADKSLAAVLAQAEPFQSGGLFKRARAKLQEFDRVTYERTQARVAYDEAILELARREAAHWQNLRLTIDEDVQQGRFQEAERKRANFAAEAAFDETHRALADYAVLISKARQESAGDGGGTRDAGERLAIRTAWRKALGDLARHCSQDLALRHLRSSELLGLSGAANAELEVMRQFLGEWDAVFGALCGRDVAGQQVTLPRDDGSRAERVRLKRLTPDRIELIEPIGRFLKWPEISLTGKLQILALVVKEPREHIYWGLLAHVAGDAERGDRAWREAAAADALMSAGVERLRDWLTVDPQ
jgi:hypothetical protein